MEDYTIKLFTLVEESAPVEEFIELYKLAFDKEPSAELITEYNSRILGQYPSSESYDSSYSY